MIIINFIDLSKFVVDSLLNLSKNHRDPLAKAINFNIQVHDNKVGNSDRGVCLIHKESINVMEHHNLNDYKVRLYFASPYIHLLISDLFS